MSRIIHFGVVARDGNQTTTAGFAEHVARWLLPAFKVEGSFTESGEPFPASHDDALHITHTTDCDVVDEDGDRIRLSVDEVAEILNALANSLPASLRVVDYVLEDDADEWGSDVHLHGSLALASIAGRRIAGDRA